VTALALRNPIAVLMACIGVVVCAVVVTPRMSIDTFPELTPPVLVVGTQAPGLGPKDVEKTISWRLEKYASATPGVDHVQSISRDGLSVMYVWLKWGTDLNSAQTLVQQNVAFAMAAIPKSLGVLPPFVLQYDPSNAPVVQVVVSGGGLTGPQLYDYAFNFIEPVLEGIPGVASAALNGGRQRQINVVVDPVRAQTRGLTAEDVARAVHEANALLPSGELIRPKRHAYVYTNAIPSDVARIGDAVVKARGGRPVLIADVARVEDGGAPDTQAVIVDGREAVYLNVLRIPGGNTLQIVDRVKHEVQTLKSLPPGVKVKVYFDQSIYVRQSYEGLKKEILQALILIAIVILMFLQSIRGTLIVAVAIPLSFAITLIILYAHGDTLNAFTLGGLTLAMGRLVDDAVVVLESIHRRHRQGLPIAEAALHGTQAVALPVLASTLTMMAVLLPVLLLQGLAKKLFVPLALTVAAAMFVSYIVSICVTPVGCRYILKETHRNRVLAQLERAIDRLRDAYVAVLDRALDLDRLIVACAAVLVIVSALVARQLPTTFFPAIDESMERVYVRLAPGTSLDQATAKMKEMGETLRRQLPRGTVAMWLLNVGSPGNARSAMNSPNWGPNMGFIRLALDDPEARSQDQQQLADQARAILTQQYPGIDFLQMPGGLVASVFANGYIAPLVVEVRNEDLPALDRQSRAVAEVARTIPGLRDVWVSLDLRYPEVHVDVDRETAGLVGVSARDVAQSTLEATLGNINLPGVWIDPKNGQSYYVVTYYDPSIVREPLRDLPARVSDGGRAVTLGAYSRLVEQTGPLAIERNALQRAAHIYAQVEGRDLGTVAADLERALRQDSRTADVRFSFVGQVDLMRTTFSGLGIALALAVMVVYMIMASQFRSLMLPFIMLFTIPVALVGIVTALLAAGQGFSIIAMMGMLMVIGIAVSNGILLVEDAHRRTAAGAPPRQAIVEAARSRLVPILMTSLATVIGLVPTAFGLERGAEANQPLALAVVGGLTSSTFLSLFLVPSIYLILMRRSAEHPTPDATSALTV
jgi:CzcA family heavy metal efflux pump